MNKNALIVAALMIAISIISVVIAYFRISHMTAPSDLAARGLQSVRQQALVFYGVFLPVVVGLISFYIFSRINANSPQTAHNIFLWLAVGAGVILEIAAAIVFKTRGLAEFTALHVLYIAAYGWLMPLLLVFSK